MKAPLHMKRQNTTVLLMFGLCGLASQVFLSAKGTTKWTPYGGEWKHSSGHNCLIRVFRYTCLIDLTDVNSNFASNIPLPVPCCSRAKLFKFDMPTHNRLAARSHQTRNGLSSLSHP